MATRKMTQCESMAVPMIQKIEVFKTSDGQKFDEKDSALEHEKSLVRSDLVRNLIYADEHADLRESFQGEIEGFIINNREALLEILK